MTAGPDLFAPGLFDGTGFREAFAWYRAHDPVARLRTPDGEEFWSVTRHADVVAVHRDTGAWSSTGGMRLGSHAAAVSAVANRMLIVSDPPVHTRLKRVLARPFSRELLARAEALVDDVVADVVRRACSGGGPDDLLVHLARIPTDVICAIMGLPRADWAWVGERTTAAFEDPSDRVRMTANAEVFRYFTELVRAGNPFVDEVRELSGGDLADAELVVNLSGILAGGNETTRYTLASVTGALAAHPSQWQRLRTGEAGPETATEEALRWSGPGMHVLRTATGPARVGGVPIEPGDRVVTWFGSANHDERVFDEPSRFDVGRTPNRHLAFGAGRHLCLGARLARMEIAAYLRALRATVTRLEPCGEPRYNGSSFTWGLASLPLRLHR